MAEAETLKKTTNGSEAPLTLDAAVVGVGVAGLYQLESVALPGAAGEGVRRRIRCGRTWDRNRYPGARFDSEAYIYQYLFSEDLYKGWSGVPVQTPAQGAGDTTSP